jgi:hypothetical protein
MFRKVFVGASVAALGLSGLAMTAGPASAAKVPVEAHGTLSCAITGKVKIKPNALLLLNDRGPTVFTAKWKSSSCSGSSGVTGAKGTMTATLPSSDCLALQALPFPGGSVTKVKYKGAAKYLPGDFTFTSGGTFTITTPLQMDAPGTGSSTVPAGRSFAGQQPSFHFAYNEPVEQFAINCTAKVKGTPKHPLGYKYGGLKKMSFGGTFTVAA